ncbi:MAG: TonB-dependent receptor [Caulobacteraceae bacterium]
MKSRYFGGVSAVAVALSLGMTATQAMAATDSAADVDAVYVTGSLIAGTPEDASVPVDVTTAQDLEAQGSPTVVELVKTITASASGLGESNRYNGGAGTASINLRGFGASRTLTLMNGRRLPDSTAAAFQGGGANLNAIPSAAIGRIEILKDGAAATYGSEAIGGVVNFITRTDLDGFEFNGQYKFISGSSGDYEASLAWGNRFDTGNVLLTAGYRHRSALDIRERDWALLPFYAPAAGGYSSNSNPGNYQTNNGTATYLFRDNGCAELGGTLTRLQTILNTTTGANVSITTPVNSANPETSTSATTCQFQFSRFNDLVNEENHYQLYGELNIDVTDDVKFHGEVSWARDDVPRQRISPSNGNTQFPTPISLGGLSGSTLPPLGLNFAVPYNLPASNPGLSDLRNQCIAAAGGAVGIITGAQCASIITAAAPGGPGVDLSQTNFRFIANAGRPNGINGADVQTIEINTFRVSGGFSGDFSDSLHWDTNVLYAQAQANTNTGDLAVNRVQAALNGYGSRLGAADQCTVAEMAVPGNAGNAAVGCFYFNPMSSAIAVSQANGATNPFYRGGVNAAVINNPDVVEWLYGRTEDVRTNQLFVAEALLNGDTGLELPGGMTQFALGAQYRWNRDISVFGDFSNNQTTPCVDSITDSTPVCGNPNGPWIFFGSGRNSDATRNVVALFGEVKAPFTDNFEVDLAARYEQYDNGIGSTFNPKLSVRWQVTDWFALRGSAGTTFRAPASTIVNTNCATGIANLSGQYRAVTTCGNPNLRPETADAYNAGFIVETGGLNLTLDYWTIKFKDELTTEGSSNLVAALFTTNGNQCGNPAYAALQARFTFTSAGCGSANVLKVDTFNVNGPSTKASGVDFRLSYDWDGWFDASYQVGVEATYLIEYSRSTFFLYDAVAATNSTLAIAAPTDRAGTQDLLSAFFSYPQTKANLWLNWHKDNLNIRWVINYTEGVAPAVNTTTSIVVPDSTQPTGYHAETLGKSGDFWQHNLNIRYDWEGVATFGLNISNIFDEDPPFLVSNYNYDYTNGNPLGRTIEITVKKAF